MDLNDKQIQIIEIAERLFAERQQQVASICLEKDVGKSAQVNARAQITRDAHK